MEHIKSDDKNPNFIKGFGEQLDAAYIENMELDVEAFCKKTNTYFERPWLTMLIDKQSGMVLAFHLDFKPPSYVSIMMVLREFVKKHSQFPCNLILEGTKEYNDKSLQELLLKYGCTLIRSGRTKNIYRPSPSVERIFRSVQRKMTDNIPGEYKTRFHKIETMCSIDDLRTKIGDLLYDNLEQLLMSKKDDFQNYDRASSRKVFYDEEFEVLTCPRTRKGTSKVWPSKGVKLNNIYYWTDEFKKLKHEVKEVEVRYDPMDNEKAFAKIEDKWIKLSAFGAGAEQSVNFEDDKK
jgi:putative transposase